MSTVQWHSYLNYLHDVRIIYGYDTSNVEHAFCGDAAAGMRPRPCDLAINARAQYEWVDPPLRLRAILTINGPHVAIDTMLILILCSIACPSRKL